MATDIGRRVVVDSSVLLRVLLGDSPVYSPAAQKWLAGAHRRGSTPVILSIALTEVVTVLRRAKDQRSHAEIVSALDSILALPVQVEEREVIEAAVELYRGRHARDWEDCVIAAHAIKFAEGRLATYDRSLASLPGVVAVAP